MAGYVPLKEDDDDGEGKRKTKTRNSRLASLDVFRGLAVLLMTFVDYAGAVLPFVSHSPWNGLHLADFVMPFFLFIAGVSLALMYKNVSDRVLATRKAVLRAIKLFLLGILLQGGYCHGLSSLTFGVDIERIRWLGILQRISVGYIVAALCEIWLPRGGRNEVQIFKCYYWHWCVMLLLSTIYMGLLYGLYVPDWQFKALHSTSSAFSTNESYTYLVKCGVRGDLGPGCNSAGMIDRYVLGIDHLYAKPAYRNMKECDSSKNDILSENSISWCHAPFEPEGILSSLTAVVTCIMGLQYGHVIVQFKAHKQRLCYWGLFSVSIFALGSFLTIIGIPLNKCLYTISYMLVTSAFAGITFCALYLLVDVCGYRHLTYPLEWIGMHSLSIFVIVTSNLAVIAIQGFYLTSPENNIIHWIVTRFVDK